MAGGVVQLPTWAHQWTQPKRFKVAKGGRGGGKSHTIAALLILMAAQRPLRILCAREVQKSIRDSVHRLIGDKIAAMGLSSFFETTSAEIRGKNGSTFLFSGLRSEVMAGLKSTEGVDICWVEEAQSVSQHSLDVLIPTIRKAGSEIWFSFNPELETDPVYLRFCTIPDDRTLLTTVGLDDNPWAPQELRDERDRAYQTDPLKAAWVWGGDCRPVVEGAIYEREIVELERSGRLTTVQYQPDADVFVSLDLGYGDHTSMLIGHVIGKERHIVAEYEGENLPQSHYIDWLKQSPYRVDHLILPHDARAHDKTNGRSPEELWRASFPKATVQVLDRIDQEIGIDNARAKFGSLWIDKSCTLLISALKKYRREQDKNTGLFGKPQHDPWSDMADSFRYWMLGAEDRRKPQKQRPAAFARAF